MQVIAFLQSSPAAFLITATLLGLVIGSFLNVVVHRLPTIMDRNWRRDCCEFLNVEAPDDEAPMNLLTPGSRCPACGHPVRAWQNIPVVSWLLLRGRCAACGARISVRYPIIECLSGAMTLCVAWRFGAHAPFLWAAVFTWALIALSAIDLDCQLLPDDITLPLLWLGVIANLFRTFTSLEASVLGVLAGYLSLWFVYHAFKWATGKEGMGYGDFKLFATLGAWLGWQYLPLVILLASLCGAVAGLGLIAARRMDRSVPMPFGPFLAAAGWIALIWGHELMSWWLGPA